MRGTPTWEMYQWFEKRMIAARAFESERAKLSRDAVQPEPPPEPAVRVWLRAG